ncbi:MAG: T9SS type A sorting domain-containing protein [Saprospiraceae bacterium]|nr:T9SS type A sorting domain-containing protein [Bacteroidia bacterium]NNE15453.1 T9SS type A sorting domain-containing protein [Saprospiraceae bacterium]NNL91629.1 T9SS type A sorting domain-containing protein [Saprospiraceae bacterium]
MKKYLPICSVLAIFILFLSNFTSESIKSFVVTTVVDGPDLPEIPFAYNDIEFPRHLIDRDTVDTGYGSGPIDTLTVAGIENNVATLGRVLFYDEKLSALENISCAGCHQQSKSFADDVALSEGISTLTKRNSMNLNDLGWSNKAHFFWDMSKKDLHEMIVLPLTDDNEIGANMNDVETKLSATSYYPKLFKKAYGDSAINEERIVEALVQFINSMVTFESKFDQASRNNFADFTEKEISGLELFSENCTFCHSQGTHNPFGFIIEDPDEEFFFSNEILEVFPFLFNNGLEEFEEDKGAGEWDEAFRNLFKIPTLRNIEVTGPYMHDGRFETLKDVLNHYSEEVHQEEWASIIPDGGYDFSQNEKDNLIAFLKTLTDKTFLEHEKWSDPFSLTNTVETLDINLVIKPNPMMEVAMIEFDNPNNENIKISVLSNSGQLLESHVVNNNYFEMRKDNYAPGMYFVEIRKDELSSLQKLIVQ